MQNYNNSTVPTDTLAVSDELTRAIDHIRIPGDPARTERLRQLVGEIEDVLRPLPVDMCYGALLDVGARLNRFRYHEYMAYAQERLTRAVDALPERLGSIARKHLIDDVELERLR